MRAAALRTGGEEDGGEEKRKAGERQWEERGSGEKRVAGRGALADITGTTPSGTGHWTLTSGSKGWVSA